MQHCTRRRVLRAGGATFLASLAGCVALPTDASDAEEPSYENLDATAVYVADEVELSMPAAIETVDATHNADLLVLPGETTADADQAVEWLAAGRVLALLGDGAETTWLSWAQSDVFRDSFENRGYGDAEPDPSLVIGAKIGLYVETYRHSWVDEPRDRDVLETLDESLVAIETATPPG